MEGDIDSEFKEKYINFINNDILYTALFFILDNNRLYESDKAKNIINRLQDLEESIYEVYEFSYVIRILEERNVPR